MQKETTVFELKSEQERVEFVQSNLPRLMFKRQIGISLSTEEKAVLFVAAIIADQVTQDMIDLNKEEGIEIIFEEGFELNLLEMQLVVLNKDDKKFVVFNPEAPGSMLCAIKTPEFKEGLQVHKEALAEYSPQLYTVPGIFPIGQKLEELQPEIVYVETVDKSKTDPEEENGEMGIIEINPEWIAEFEHEELFS